MPPRFTSLALVFAITITASIQAQSPPGGPRGGGGPKPEDLTSMPQAIGEPGPAWYTTWDTALEEAKRSNRPIFFMAAAATCNGISGVF